MVYLQKYLKQLKINHKTMKCAELILKNKFNTFRDVKGDEKMERHGIFLVKKTEDCKDVNFLIIYF